MSGSKKLFVYEDDTTKRYLVTIDEGNALATGFPAATNADLTLPVLPRYLKMRYVNVLSDTGIGRRIYVPTTANPVWQGTDRTMQLFVFVSADRAVSKEFTVSSRVGEKERYLTTADTGQTDTEGEGLTPVA